VARYDPGGGPLFWAVVIAGNVFLAGSVLLYYAVGWVFGEAAAGIATLCGVLGIVLLLRGSRPVDG
jgi:hypothetical protein